MNDRDGAPTPDDWFRQGWADLVWGSRCVGCARPGTALCSACAGRLAAPTLIASAAHPWTATGGPYAGALRAAVVAHKEQGVRALGRPLGEVLAETVRLLLPSPALTLGGPRVPVVLVPIPSRRAALRLRGDDPWRRVVRSAAAVLRRGGVPAHVAPVLRVAETTRDQAGLAVDERAANLAGAMRVDGAALATVARRRPRALVVLCDDVLTTGATVREGRRALEAVGVRLHGVAVVARVIARREGRR